MVAQNGHQHDVDSSRHGPQQGQTVAAVTHRDGASEGGGEICQEASYAQGVKSANCLLGDQILELHTSTQEESLIQLAPHSNVD